MAKIVQLRVSCRHLDLTDQKSKGLKREGDILYARPQGWGIGKKTGKDHLVCELELASYDEWIYDAIQDQIANGETPGQPEPFAKCEAPPDGKPPGVRVQTNRSTKRVDLRMFSGTDGIAASIFSGEVTRPNGKERLHSTDLIVDDSPRLVFLGNGVFEEIIS